MQKYVWTAFRKTITHKTKLLCDYYQELYDWLGTSFHQPDLQGAGFLSSETDIHNIICIIHNDTSIDAQKYIFSAKKYYSAH